jgi:hypothetical protein
LIRQQTIVQIQNIESSARDFYVSAFFCVFSFSAFVDGLSAKIHLPVWEEKIKSVHISHMN